MDRIETDAYEQGLISDDVDHVLKDALLELRACKRQHDGVAEVRAPQHVLSGIQA